VTDDADELDRRLARLFEEGRRREDPADHPSPEKLSAYQANELPPAEADEIQEHLTGCSLCTELLLDLQSFLEPEEEDQPQEGVADFGAEAGWRELRERMEWKDEGREPKGFWLRRFLSLQPAYARAAAWAAIVSLAAYAGTLSHLLNQPRFNLPFQDLEAVDTNRRGLATPAYPEIHLSSEAREFILSLETLGDLPESGYRVEIRNKAKELVWSQDGLRKSNPYRFVLVLPERLFPAGEYEIHLKLQDDPQATVQIYPLEIVR